MNKRETLKIMAVMRAAYPGYYRDVTQEDAAAAANLWEAMFARQPYSLVGKAVKLLISTSSRPPSVAQVNEAILDLTSPPGLTEQEAWNLVYRAVCNSGYESREEFQRLPEELRRVVGSPNVLREWALMDAREVQTVVASNFQRSYRARAAEDRRRAALPEDVKKLLLSAAQLQGVPWGEGEDVAKA